VLVGKVTMKQVNPTDRGPSKLFHMLVEGGIPSQYSHRFFPSPASVHLQATLPHHLPARERPRWSTGAVLMVGGGFA